MATETPRTFTGVSFEALWHALEAERGHLIVLLDGMEDDTLDDLLHAVHIVAEEAEWQYDARAKLDDARREIGLTANTRPEASSDGR